MLMYRSCSTILFCLLAEVGRSCQTQAQVVRTSAPSFDRAVIGESAVSVPADDLDPSTPLKHPYAVSLRNSVTGAYVCGGALVNPEYVVTAAQCVDDGVSVLVAVGNPSEVNHEVIKIDRILPHPVWSGDKRRGYDIALLKLESPSKAPPVKFPWWRTKISDRETLSLLSRGRTSSSSIYTDILQRGLIDFIPTDECSAIDVLGGPIQPGMMCLGGYGARACVGDEGSPVVRVTSTKKDLLLGIASITNSCGDPNAVGIYTRVDIYGSWMKSVIHKL